MLRKGSRPLRQCDDRINGGFGPRAEYPAAGGSVIYHINGTCNCPQSRLPRICCSLCVTVHKRTKKFATNVGVASLLLRQQIVE